MSDRPAPRTIRGPLGLALACLASALVGAIAARGPGPVSASPHVDDHTPPAKAAQADVKGPITEVLHCPLAFAGVHLQKENPTNAQVAYHYCKPLNDGVAQCLLYDGTGPDARLIGVEYLVSDAIHAAMPEAEKAYWHDHTHEVDAHLIRSLTQSGADEAATLGKVRTLWGKVFHTWTSGAVYPEGPPKLFWSVTGVAPLTLPDGFKLPTELSPAKP